MENKAKTQQEIEQEMLELNEQFSDFLHTKGIGAKFKIAFGNMKHSANKHYESNKANYEAIKAQSLEDNKEFVEFLNTKGIKAKYNLVIENIKNSAKEAQHDTAVQIAKIHAQTQKGIHRAKYGKSYVSVAPESYTATSLTDEFNAFLKSKGLEGKYTILITEEE